MASFPTLAAAEPLPGYQLHLRYADGVEGVVDLSHWVGTGVFEAWKDELAFCAVQIGRHGILEWSDEIDMDPDAFYLRLIGKTFEEYAHA